MISNIFAQLTDSPDRETFVDLLNHGDLKIERIVSHGQTSPQGFWYDQDRHEWVLVLRGRARLEFADEPKSIELGPGDFFNIPAHCRHRVAWTAPEEATVWLAIHYGFKADEGFGADEDS